jgi:hypothetical protein
MYHDVPRWRHWLQCCNTTSHCLITWETVVFYNQFITKENPSYHSCSSWLLPPFLTNQWLSLGIVLQEKASSLVGHLNFIHARTLSTEAREYTLVHCFCPPPECAGTIELLLLWRAWLLEVLAFIPWSPALHITPKVAKVLVSIRPAAFDSCSPWPTHQKCLADSGMLWKIYGAFYQM